MRCFSSLGWLGNPGIRTRLTAPAGLSQFSTPYSLLAPRHPPHALSSLATLLSPSPGSNPSSLESRVSYLRSPQPMGIGSGGDDVLFPFLRLVSNISKLHQPPRPRRPRPMSS